MPRIQPNSKPSAEETPYGLTHNDNTMTFQERLMKRFAAHEFVTVLNVDDEAFIWQYLPAHEEEVEYTADPMKITRRGKPEMWQVDAGEMETLVGANAYIMIEGLYKKLVAKKKMIEDPAQAGQARNFNYADGGQQERWINEIFVGKAQPTFGVQSAEDALGVTHEQPKPKAKLVGATD